MSGQVTRLAGVDELSGFSLKELFSEVFSKHSNDEVEESFTVGTRSTTPPITEVDAGWPRPWLFFRTLAAAVLTYLLFLVAWYEFANLNLVPGLVIVGSFAVPLSTLVLFIELNVARNVSLYVVLRLLFWGGIMGIVFSLILFEVAEGLSLGWLGAPVAGLVEEPGKLLALVIVANVARYRYRLNGLLFGAAVGAGFAAFESAGYALRFGMLDADAMDDVITVRGILSPFGHIVWTAMCGGALWRVKGGKPLSLDVIRDPKFLRIFFIAVCLHMVWNSPFELPFYGKYIVLGCIAWTVVFALIQDGLRELREEQRKALLPQTDAEE